MTQGVVAGEPEALWAAWTSSRDTSARAALVEAYRGFARMLAARCYSRRYSRELEFGDYEQYAHIGLLEAIDRFDPGQGLRFEAYARRRVMGAILNGVESLSELQRQIATHVAVRRERAASLAQGAARSTPDAMQRLADLAVGLAIGFMLDDAALYVDGEPPDPAATPYERVELAQLRKRIAAFVDELPDAESRVIRHHYYQHIPFDEIAAACGLSKGRISQIHHAALRRLQRRCTAQDGVLLVT